MSDRITIIYDEDGTTTKTFTAPNGGRISAQLFREARLRPLPAMIRVYDASDQVIQVLLFSAVWSIDHHIDRGPKSTEQT